MTTTAGIQSQETSLPEEDGQQTEQLSQPKITSQDELTNETDAQNTAQADMHAGTCRESEKDGISGNSQVVEADDITQDNKANIGIQANDYEIERISGVLPARRRIIPFKFRDFHDPDNIPEDLDDEDYHPGEGVLRRMKTGPLRRPGASGRGPGRPRKNRRDHSYDRLDPDQIPGENYVEIIQTEDETLDRKMDAMTKRPRGRPSKDSPWGSGLLPKIFKCLQCEKSFSQKGNLKVHIRTHTDERPFKCDVDSCGKAFRSKESLKRHKLAHMGIKMFECEICKERFTSNVALKEHISRHTDSRPYKCDHCTRWFRQVSCLRRHLTTHSNEQPHGCDVCGRRFSMMVYLKSHMRTHTGEKPFQCKVCNKSFAHQSDLVRHQTVHSGVKPYPCEVCGARFSDPSSRRRHVKEHMGYKPYICQLCGDAFKRSGQLKAHLNKKHMNYKEDVVISKQGPFNALQFDFKRGSRFAQNYEQTQEVLSLDGNVINLVAPDSQTLLLQQATADQNVQLLESHQQQQKPASDQEIMIHIQQDLPESSENQNPTSGITSQVLGGVDASQLLQGGQIVLAGAQVESGSQGSDEGLVAQELILSPGNQGEPSGSEEQKILEETQHIIQQIQSQLEQTGSHPGQSGPLQVAYQIIHDDDNQQIVEIQYQPLENSAENKAANQEEQKAVAQIQEYHEDYSDNQHQEPVEDVLMSQDTESTRCEKYNETGEVDGTASDTIPEEQSQKAEPLPGQVIHNVTLASNDDFVIKPDFSSQEYYNWLSNFTELCKLVPMPLKVDLFQKISQVHKTLSDILANPSGILTNKENFRILMDISKELNGIINEHLAYVLQTLDPNEVNENH